MRYAALMVGAMGLFACGGSAGGSAGGGAGAAGAAGVAREAGVAHPAGGGAGGGGVRGAGAVAASTAGRAEAGQSRGAPAIRGKDGDIPLRTLEGRPTTLSTYGARVTVVALWATFCAPCMQELPMVNALYRAYRGRPDVSVVAVNIDDTRQPAGLAHVQDVVKRLGLTMPCLVGGERVLERLAARAPDGSPTLALPLLVIIDPGFGLHRHVGFYPGTTTAAYVAEKSAAIDTLLRGEELPPDAARAAGPPPGPPPPGSSIKMHIPVLSDKQRAAMLPQLRARLAQTLPSMSKADLDALMKKVETASHTGGEVTIPVN